MNVNEMVPLDDSSLIDVSWLISVDGSIIMKKSWFLLVLSL